jgi:hypothetical protein
VRKAGYPEEHVLTRWESGDLGDLLCEPLVSEYYSDCLIFKFLIKLDVSKSRVLSRVNTAVRKHYESGQGRLGPQEPYAKFWL